MTDPLVRLAAWYLRKTQPPATNRRAHFDALDAAAVAQHKNLTNAAGREAGRLFSQSLDLRGAMFGKP